MTLRQRSWSYDVVCNLPISSVIPLDIREDILASSITPVDVVLFDLVDAAGARCSVLGVHKSSLGGHALPINWTQCLERI